MANYRRKLSKSDLNLIHSIYKVHTDDKGGIFTKDKRKKLLGLKQEHGKYFEDTADFWYDVRTTVTNALKDLELFFDVAHKKQIKDVIHDTPLKEELSLPKISKDHNEIYFLSRQIPSFKKTLTALLQKSYKYKKTKLPSGQIQKYYEHVEEEEEWRAILVHDIINICITYLNDHNLISSKAHARLTDEFQDMVNVEIARGTKLSLNERVKGFV